MFLYSKTFIHKNRTCKVIALISLLLGGFSFALGNVDFIALPVVAQAIGVLLISTSIYMATAFLLRQYSVSIDKNSASEGDVKELYDLIIKEQKGKKVQKVCHVGLANIFSVELYDASKKSERREEKKRWQAENGGLRYIYDTRFSAGQRIVVRCDVGDHRCSIYICFDESLYRILSETITKQ